MTTYTKILKPRQICDLELLLNGAFDPLEGFLDQADYEGVLNNMRLADGRLWPIPVNLPFTEEEKAATEAADRLVLALPDGLEIAELEIGEFYKPDLAREAVAVFGADDNNHPFVQILHGREGCWYMGGKVTQLNDIPHADFENIRHTPRQLREEFKRLGWNKIVAFQTRNPMHKSHYHLTLRALQEAGEDAKLLLHPVVGITQDVDIHYQLRVRCYQKLLAHYPENGVFLSLLPLSMRMAGPREALWHAIIRKNYGATHFIVGRDHAGPSFKRQDGEDFFGHYDAQELLIKHADEIGIKVIVSRRIVYVEDHGKYMSDDELQPGMKILNISGTEQRALLREGKDLHEWFTFPEIMNELRQEFAA